MQLGSSLFQYALNQPSWSKARLNLDLLLSSWEIHLAMSADIFKIFYKNTINYQRVSISEQVIGWGYENTDVWGQQEFETSNPPLPTSCNN